MLGNAFLTRQPQQRALRIALVVLKCLGGEASGHLMQLNESARTALYRAGMISSGVSIALAICRRDVAQCLRVCSGSSSAARMIAMASTKNASIKVDVSVIRNHASLPAIDADCCKYT
jgi:hypothetical protein